MLLDFETEKPSSPKHRACTRGPDQQTMLRLTMCTFLTSLSRAGQVASACKRTSLNSGRMDESMLTSSFILPLMFRTVSILPFGWHQVGTTYSNKPDSAPYKSHLEGSNTTAEHRRGRVVSE